MCVPPRPPKPARKVFNYCHSASARSKPAQQVQQEQPPRDVESGKKLFYSLPASEVSDKIPLPRSKPAQQVQPAQTPPVVQSRVILQSHVAYGLLNKGSGASGPPLPPPSLRPRQSQQDQPPLQDEDRGEVVLSLDGKAVTAEKEGGGGGMVGTFLSRAAL